MKEQINCLTCKHHRPWGDTRERYKGCDSCKLKKGDNWEAKETGSCSGCKHLNLHCGSWKEDMYGGCRPNHYECKKHNIRLDKEKIKTRCEQYEKWSWAEVYQPKMSEAKKNCTKAHDCSVCMNLMHHISPYIDEKYCYLGYKLKEPKEEVSCNDCDYYGECDRQGGKYCKQHSKYDVKPKTPKSCGTCRWDFRVWDKSKQTKACHPTKGNCKDYEHWEPRACGFCVYYDGKTGCRKHNTNISTSRKKSKAYIHKHCEHFRNRTPNIQTCRKCGKTKDWGNWGNIFSRTDLCQKCWNEKYNIPKSTKAEQYAKDTFKEFDRELDSIVNPKKVNAKGEWDYISCRYCIECQTPNICLERYKRANKPCKDFKRAKLCIDCSHSTVIGNIKDQLNNPEIKCPYLNGTKSGYDSTCEHLEYNPRALKEYVMPKYYRNKKTEAQRLLDESIKQDIKEMKKQVKQWRINMALSPAWLSQHKPFNPIAPWIESKDYMKKEHPYPECKGCDNLWYCKDHDYNVLCLKGTKQKTTEVSEVDDLYELSYEDIQKKIGKLKERREVERKEREKELLEKINTEVFEYQSSDRYIYREDFIKYLMKLKICSRKKGKEMRKIRMIDYTSNGGVGEYKHYQYLKYKYSSYNSRDLEEKEFDLIESTIEHQEPYIKQKAIEELCEIAPNCEEVLNHMRKQKQPKKCPECGCKIRKGAQYCSACGGRLA